MASIPTDRALASGPMRYVALLRGIAPANPNMRNDKLRLVFDELGFARARTVLSSGNVVFDAERGDATELEARLQAAWPERLGFESMTIVRRADEVRRMVAANPFGDRTDTPEARLQVTFLKHEPSGDVAALRPAADAGYAIVAVEPGAVFSIVDLSGARTPDLMRWLERTYGRDITTRTWRSVNRIAAALG